MLLVHSGHSSDLETKIKGGWANARVNVLGGRKKASVRDLAVLLPAQERARQASWLAGNHSRAGSRKRKV